LVDVATMWHARWQGATLARIRFRGEGWPAKRGEQNILASQQGRTTCTHDTWHAHNGKKEEDNWQEEHLEQEISAKSEEEEKNVL